MKKLILLSFSITLLTLASCLDLAPLLFNPDDSISAYLWEENPDNWYFESENYPIAAGEFHYFQLDSDFEGKKETLHALYLGDLESIDTDTILMYNHGNAANMDVYYPRAQLLYHTGGQSRYGVLMFDYRGFGLSTGTSTEKSLSADVSACLKWLKSHGLTEDRLILYGFSLGSIPSVDLAANPQDLTAHKLMLEAPIGSMNTLSQNGSSLSMPVSFFASLETDNIAKIKKVKQDLLWIHGLEDGFIDYTTHGEAVYNNHEGQYKISIPVRGGDHGDTPFKMGEDKYMEAMYQFIKR